MEGSGGKSTFEGVTLVKVGWGMEERWAGEEGWGGQEGWSGD